MTSAISTTILHFPAVPRRGRPRLSAILCTLRQRGVDDGVDGSCPGIEVP
jgi:hypothetical protein